MKYVLTILAMCLVGCGQQSQRSQHSPSTETNAVRYPTPTADQAKANSAVFAKIKEIRSSYKRQEGEKAPSKDKMVKEGYEMTEKFEALDWSGCSLGFKLAFLDYHHSCITIFGTLERTSVGKEVLMMTTELLLTGRNPNSIAEDRQSELYGISTINEKAYIIFEHSVDQAYP